MNDVIVANTLEDLYEFLNEKGVLEIALRGKNKRFTNFQKIALNEVQKKSEKEQLAKVFNKLYKNNNILEDNIESLNNISALNTLNLVISGVNLFATCAGFAIMNTKLEGISNEVSEVVNLYKQTNLINAEFEFNKIIAEHSNMLDGRSRNKFYTEEKMRELISGEYNVLTLLIDCFCKNVTANKENLMVSILSLLGMFSTALTIYDEQYYFGEKKTDPNAGKWHLDHEKWNKIFDRITSKEFINLVQDWGLLELDLSTIETDKLFMSVKEQALGLKQDVIDNQRLILAFDNKELFDLYIGKVNSEVKEEIENALKEANLPVKNFENQIMMAIA